jgi:hypothetical protein
VTHDEALALVSKFLADHGRPKLMWGANDPPLLGTPILYVPFEEEDEEKTFGALLIVVEVEAEDAPGGLDYVMVSIGRETVTLGVERTRDQAGDSIQVTFTEDI